MALDFPASPSIGDIYTSGGRRWQWDGQSWNSTTPTSLTNVSGILALANGGTGADNAATARSNLGAAALGANSDITSLAGITGGISTVDDIQFDTAAGVTPAVAQIAWDNDYKTFSFGMDLANETQRVGFSSYVRFKASTAVTKGQLLMRTGTVGASGVITAAPATGVTDGETLVGIACETLALNAFGHAIDFGLGTGFTTTGASVGETWADGDVLYYNPAFTGGLTKVKPSAPDLKAIVGVVVNAGPGASGSFFVKIEPGTRLGSLDSDVQVGTPANNDFLVYDSSQSRWENYSASAARTALGLGTLALQDADNVTLSGGTIDDIPIGGGTPSSGAFTTLTASASVSDQSGNVRLLPQNSQSTGYTAVLSDSGKHLLHPSADTTPRTFTIPANASVAFPVGTAITFVNQNGAGALTIAITTDTMRLAGPGTTGSRTLAANGIATALKITSTEWIISGTGLT